jgi:hypothetical protein
MLQRFIGGWKPPLRKAHMARRETDREDLWAEAVALTVRAELFLPGRIEPILIGRRPNGWWSIYFGQDVMLQFTAEGRLRRAYRAGELFRTQGTTLARLTRERTASETILRRHDLAADELSEFRTWMRAELAELDAAFQSDAVIVQRLALPDLGEIRDRERKYFLTEATRTLHTILTADRFLAPAIRGKTN